MQKIMKEVDFQTFGLECIVLLLVAKGLIPADSEIKMMGFRANVYASVTLVVTYCVIVLRDLAILPDTRKLIIPTAKLLLILTWLLWCVSGSVYFCTGIPANVKWIMCVFFVVTAIGMTNIVMTFIRNPKQGVTA